MKWTMKVGTAAGRYMEETITFFVLEAVTGATRIDRTGTHILVVNIPGGGNSTPPWEETEPPRMRKHPSARWSQPQPLIIDSFLPMGWVPPKVKTWRERGEREEREASEREKKYHDNGVSRKGRSNKTRVQGGRRAATGGDIRLRSPPLSLKLTISASLTPSIILAHPHCGNQSA